MIEAHAATEMQALCCCTKHAKELVELGFRKTSVASIGLGQRDCRKPSVTVLYAFPLRFWQGTARANDQVTLHSVMLA